jgi:hypothetical protein
MTGQTSGPNVQNGAGPFASNKFETVPRYTCTGRDLTVYVHADPNAGLLMSFYNAGIWLFEQNAPLNQGNPYTRYKTQAGFGTFGISCVCSAKPNNAPARPLGMPNGLCVGP